VKELITEFEKRINAEMRQQKKLDIVEERDLRKEELFEKYIAKMLYK